MRFIHTGDWHLGRAFYNTALIEDQQYVLEQFVACVAERKPDLVLIAGNVYDRAVPPTDAIKLLDKTLSRLILGARVPVILIAGNHDNPQRLQFGARSNCGFRKSRRRRVRLRLSRSTFETRMDCKSVPPIFGLITIAVCFNRSQFRARC